MALIDSFLELLGEHHDIVRRSIAGLPQEALDETGEHVRNSAAMLTCHIAGSERFWIGDVIAGEPSERDREAEFRVRGLAEVDLRRQLAEAEEQTGRIVSGLSEADLATRRSALTSGGHIDITVGWVLLHVLEHTAYHAGQLSIIRRAWLDKKAAERG